LIVAGPGVFTSHPTELRTVIASRRDLGPLLERLLNGGHSVIAGRIAGACRNIGRDREADEILAAMKAAGYDVRETDPFQGRLPGYVYRRDDSPYTQRIRLMWETMRGVVIERFTAPPRDRQSVERSLEAVEEIYVTDAYRRSTSSGAPRGRLRSGRFLPLPAVWEGRLADWVAP
jgi:hypothetical protein